LLRHQALLENARTDLKRYQKEMKRHAIPEQQMAQHNDIAALDFAVAGRMVQGRKLDREFSERANQKSTGSVAARDLRPARE
jgi:hypothetical protein